jgi:hypothetical protein
VSTVSIVTLVNKTGKQVRRTANIVRMRAPQVVHDITDRVKDVADSDQATRVRDVAGGAVISIGSRLKSNTAQVHEMPQDSDGDTKSPEAG